MRIPQIPTSAPIAHSAATAVGTTRPSPGPAIPTSASPSISTSTAASLAASEHARGLIGLDLGFNAIGDAGLVAIARSPHLAGLRSLALRGCRYGDAGLLALANEATFVGLETLDLSYCDGPRGDGDGWRALAASQRFPRLRWLGSRGSPVPEDVQAALAGRGADDEPEY